MAQQNPKPPTLSQIKEAVLNNPELLHKLSRYYKQMKRVLK